MYFSMSKRIDYRLTELEKKIFNKSGTWTVNDIGIWKRVKRIRFTNPFSIRFNKSGTWTVNDIGVWEKVISNMDHP